MLENANSPKAKRQKLTPAAGTMPDATKFGVTRHFYQAELETPEETPDASASSGPRHGTPNAPTVTEDKGKDVAEDAAGVTGEASSSKKLPASEVASTSSRRSDVDLTGDEEANPTGDEEANLTGDEEATVTAVANASTIAVEATDAKVLTVVEKKQSLTNPVVESALRNRDPPLFQDRPDQTGFTSGMGNKIAFYLMALPEITEGAADHAVVREPPMGIGGNQPEPVTYYVPTVGVAYANGGGDRMATASMEMVQVDDPEQLGVDGLLRPNH